MISTSLLSLVLSLLAATLAGDRAAAPAGHASTPGVARTSDADSHPPDRSGVLSSDPGYSDYSDDDSFKNSPTHGLRLRVRMSVAVPPPSSSACPELLTVTENRPRFLRLCRVLC